MLTKVPAKGAHAYHVPQALGKSICTQLRYALLVHLYCCSFTLGRSLQLSGQRTKGKIHTWLMLSLSPLGRFTVMHSAGNVTVDRSHLSVHPSNSLLLWSTIFRL